MGFVLEDFVMLEIWVLVTDRLRWRPTQLLRSGLAKDSFWKMQQCDDHDHPCFIHVSNT